MKRYVIINGLAYCIPDALHRELEHCYGNVCGVYREDTINDLNEVIARIETEYKPITEWYDYYTRVSDEDQVKGNSLTDQDVRLRQFCERENIVIKGKYSDDGISAKTFDRADYMRMRQDVKRVKPDFILFINWKRFSRNFEEGVREIRLFRESGITPDAIDEHIDFNQTGYKYMLAFYLVNAEVDNDQRSEATTRGMRRSMKQGRYCATAPQGYLNERDADLKPILKADPVKSKLIAKMFDLLATGQYSQQEVRRTMVKEGLKYSRAQFGNAIRNKIYISKLSIPAYKGEPEEIVNGLHEPLVDEGTFYRVQDIISGKRQRIVTRVSEEMPLRGFLYCTHDHKMTGSCSHGHGGNYHYYHCPNILCERYRADKVNEGYISLLEYYRLEPETAEMIEEASISLLKPEPQITSALQQKYIDGNITVIDYQQIRTRYEAQLFDLKQKLSDLTIAERELSANFGNVTKLLINLPDLYREANPERKREIIGSITPNKLYFENKKVRTSEMNLAISLMVNIDKGFSASHILHKVQYEPDVRDGDPSHTLSRTLRLKSDLLLLSELYKKVAA